MELTARERQLKILRRKLYNELEVRLKKNIEMNYIHPDPISRDEIVDEAANYIFEQFFNRCASRQIDVVSFHDDDIIGLLQDYRNEDQVAMNGGRVVNKGIL
jgi:hypothetical protein